jgi:hypothetical protein
MYFKSGKRLIYATKSEGEPMEALVTDESDKSQLLRGKQLKGK